jgi:hypothetical protein
MDVFALESKFQDLNASPFMTVIAPSELTIEFRDDNTFGLFGLISMRMDLAEGNFLELDGTHSASGTYQANGSVITFVGVVHEVQYGTMRAYIDGELDEGLFTDENSPVSAPVFEFPASSSYACSESELILQYSAPTSPSVTEMWARVDESP